MPLVRCLKNVGDPSDVWQVTVFPIVSRIEALEADSDGHLCAGTQEEQAGEPTGAEETAPAAAPT